MIHLKLHIRSQKEVEAVKKNLSIVIGLAMAISMGTSCFAKDEVSSSGTTESTVSQDISDYSNFTLDNL